MTYFLWATPDRTVPHIDRTKKGRAWTREAEGLRHTNPGQLERDFEIYKMGLRSKRRSVYVQWVQEAWSVSQWWVEMKKEEDFWRAGACWGRSGQGNGHPRGKKRPRSREHDEYRLRDKQRVQHCVS